MSPLLHSDQLQVSQDRNLVWYTCFLLVKQAGSLSRFARGFPRVALGNSAGSRRCCVTSPGAVLESRSYLMLVLRCDESVVTLLVLKARVQRTVRVVLARIGERVARTGRESRSTRESERGRGSSFKLSDFGHRPQAAGRIRVSVWGGAPHMSMVSDDFGLHYLIFHSFRERYTQAFISVVTYIMMPKFNCHPHHLWLTMPASFRD